MKFLTFGAALLGLSPFASASPLHVERMETSPALTKRQSCTHGPQSRNCWSNGFNDTTDMYTKWPNTGRVVQFTLEVTNTTCNPDGAAERTCLLFNNQMPGPTITGNWGDIFEITVRNKMQHNGTSIHWHGLRQLNSNTEDGVSTTLSTFQFFIDVDLTKRFQVNGVTECALAPGDTKTYRFQATEYGSTWYHSHFSAQYGDGTIGTLV